MGARGAQIRELEAVPGQDGVQEESSPVVVFEPEHREVGAPAEDWPGAGLQGSAERLGLLCRACQTCGV